MACGCKGRIRQVRPAQVVNAVAVRTEDRERAIERYTQDQAAERIYRARVTADRQAHPVAVFLKVISGWTAGMYGRSTEEVFISLDQLERGSTTVDTVVHELAHHTSGAEDLEEPHTRHMTIIAGYTVQLTHQGSFDELMREARW